MKKFMLVFFASILLVGCMTNTNNPKKEVENLFYKYQTLDNEIIKQIDLVLSDEANLTDLQKSQYEAIIKKNYRDLTYEIKNETIDGDKAIVTAEITVYNYGSVISDMQNLKDTNDESYYNEEGIFDESLYNTDILDKLENTDEKVTYTVDINLTKIDNNWVLDSLDKTTRQKISGTYKGENN
ncbi:MAG: hypothetical protein ACK5NF_06985 [Bacilli bacterium]